MQLDIIRAIQASRFPSLSLFFEFITSVGGPQFLVVALPLLFWCVSTRIGFRFMLIVLVSIYINSLLKELGPSLLPPNGELHTARPFVEYPGQVWTCRQDPDYDPEALLARLCYEEDSFAFPSGHAQTSLVAWGYLARLIRRRVFTAVAIGWIMLVGVSRIYLGQHWPTDIVGGWLIGAALLLAALRLFHLYPHGSRRLNWLLVGLLGLLLPVLLVIDQDAKFTRSGVLGLLGGSALGYVLQQQHVRFLVGAGWPVQLGKIVIGVLGIVVVQIGLRAGLPEARSIEVLLGLLSGLWAFWGAPLVFQLLWGRDELRLVTAGPQPPPAGASRRD